MSGYVDMAGRLLPMAYKAYNGWEGSKLQKEYRDRKNSSTTSGKSNKRVWRHPAPPKKKSLSSRKQLIAAPGGSFTTFDYGSHKLNASFLKTAVDDYVVNSSAKVIAAIGKQAVANLAVVFQQTDLAAMRTAVTAASTARLCYKESYVTQMITNQDNGNAMITLYDVICRRATTESPTTCWVNGTSGGGSSNQQNVVGAEPSSCARFNDFYTIKKIFQFWLGAGQSHAHIMKFNPNRSLPGEVQDVTSYIPGLTHATMMVVNGGPYNDSTTKSQVSSGAASIDIVTAISYKFTFINSLTDSLFTLSTLPAAFTVAESIMNENTGAASADIQA